MITGRKFLKVAKHNNVIAYKSARVHSIATASGIYKKHSA